MPGGNRPRHHEPPVRTRDAPPQLAAEGFQAPVEPLRTDVPRQQVALLATNENGTTQLQLSDETGLTLRRMEDDARLGSVNLAWELVLPAGYEETELLLQSTDQRVEAGDDVEFSSHAGLGYLVQRDNGGAALTYIGGNLFNEAGAYNLNALVVDAGFAATWTQHTGTFAHAAGVDGVTHTVNHASNRNFATWDVGAPNFRIETVISEHGSGGVAFRYTDADNCWFFNNATGNLVRRTAGVETIMDTWDGTGGAHRANPANWDRSFVRVICYGDDIFVYRDGVEVCSVNSSSHNTADRVGLYAPGPSLSTIRWESQKVFTATSAVALNYDTAYSELTTDMGRNNGDLETARLTVNSIVFQPSEVEIAASRINLRSTLDDHVAEISIQTENGNYIGDEGQPAFANSWVNFNGGFSNLYFYKDPFGIVHIHGTIKDGTVGGGANIFVLPVGYRPDFDLIFPIVSNDAFGRVTVRDTGGVEVAVGSSTWAALDGITFRAVAA